MMVLLGILTAVIAPRFASRDGFADYALRDQIIAAARVAQQRAMYDHSANACYRLEIRLEDSGAVIFAQRFNGGGYENIGPTDEWRNGIRVQGAAATTTRVYFDGLGSPFNNVENCAAAAVPAQINIAIAGPTGLGVCIYETGFIGDQAC